MLHPISYLRARCLAAGLTEPAAQLMSDVALNPFRTPLERARALQRACQSLCWAHGLTVRVRGELPSEPVIYVSNHLGYVDPIVICSLTPCSPVAKVEVRSWPFVGTVARSMNAIFVERGNAVSAAAALRTAMRRLESGVSVLNFPEGTTTRGAMLPFRRGIFGLSVLLGVPVVPLAISFTEAELCWVDDDSLLHHYARVLLGRAHAVELRIGPSLRMQARETPAEFAARVRSWIGDARATSAARPRLVAGRPKALEVTRGLPPVLAALDAAGTLAARADRPNDTAA